MGSLFGSRLNDLANVTLFGAWPAQIDALQREGLTVIHPDGSESHHFLDITNHLDAVPPADIALILVKSYQTARAARQAARVLRQGGLAITLQNGLGNLEILAEAVGPERATLGVTAQGATVLEPGRLRHAGDGVTYLAKLPARESHVEAIAQLLNDAELETKLVDNADSLVWGKLAINAGINPLTALLEVSNGSLAEDEQLRRVMSAAANEVAAVARAQGITLPFDDAAGRVAEVSRATAGNRSSMLQDISRAAPTEIEAISGAVVRFGQRLGIPTPINQLLLRAVKSKEIKRLNFSLDRLGVDFVNVNV